MRAFDAFRTKLAHRVLLALVAYANTLGARAVAVATTISGAVYASVPKRTFALIFADAGAVNAAVEITGWFAAKPIVLEPPTFDVTRASVATIVVACLTVVRVDAGRIAAAFVVRL